MHYAIITWTHQSSTTGRSMPFSPSKRSRRKLLSNSSRYMGSSSGMSMASDTSCMDSGLLSRIS